LTLALATAAMFIVAVGFAGEFVVARGKAGAARLSSSVRNRGAKAFRRVRAIA